MFHACPACLGSNRLSSQSLGSAEGGDGVGEDGGAVMASSSQGAGGREEEATAELMADKAGGQTAKGLCGTTSDGTSWSSCGRSGLDTCPG